MWKVGLIVLLAVEMFWSLRATPDYPVLYRIKRLEEKAYFLLLRKPEDEVNFSQGLLNLRLKELNHLVVVKEFDLLYPASLRYAAAADEAVNLVKVSGKAELITETKQLLVDQKADLHNLLKTFPAQDSDSGKYIQDDINYLTIYLGKI